MALLDLAWPHSLQVGPSKPVALLIVEDKETEEAIYSVGYRFFNDLQKFSRYVAREILAR